MFALLSLNLYFGCVSKVSNISPIQPMQPPASTDQIDQCGWVQVNEVVKTSLFVVPISTESRSYHNQLYYCCPGPKKNPAPMCYQAQWAKTK